MECRGLAHTLQSALEMGQEARIVQIDFSATFDRVNHQGILFKLSSVGVGNSVLPVLTQLLSNRSQYFVGNGCLSKLVNVVSGEPQGRVLGHQLFLLYTAELFSVVENKLYAESLCLSRCLFLKILVTLCLMVWDWWVSRAEPILSRWHDLLFLFVAYCFIFFFLPCVGCVGLGSSD